MGSLSVMDMGIRLYIRDVIARHGSDEGSGESDESDISSRSGEFIRNSIVEGGKENRERAKSTGEGGENRY
jgi:hypothetical protein